MANINNVINNTIGGPISGQTNTLTLTNSSNTASSASRETILVGGGSAGDPTINFTVSGVTNWEVGIDNSVNDNLTISNSAALGTNDRWRMTTAGVRTMPSQPCMLANKSATTANATGDSTQVTMVFDNVIYDQGSNYNSGTGTFTFPVTGRYFVQTCIGLTNLTAGHNEGNVQAIGTSLSGYLWFASPGAQRDSINNLKVSGSMLFNATAGDTLVIKILVGGSTKTVGIEGGNPPGVIPTYFGVFLIA